MTLNAQVGNFAAPTVDGNDSTINLPGGFDLKALIFWMPKNTADGAVNPGGAVTGQFCIGYSTKDSGSIQQAYSAVAEVDAAGNMDASRGMNTTAILKGYSDGGGTVDFEADVITFDSEQFILDWANAPSTALIVCYLALGGSDITAARAFTFQQSTAVATQDVTINAGFGQPNLLFLTWNALAALGDAAGDYLISLGVGKSDSARRCTMMGFNDGATTMDGCQYQGSRLIATMAASGVALDSEADLSTVGGWPTDGFELSYSDQAGIAHQVMGLALKGDFVATIGSFSAPTAAPPQTVNLSGASDTPKALLVWGWPLATSAGVRTTDGDLSAFWMGASDNTNELSAGMTQDEGALASAVSVYLDRDKAVQFRTLGATAVLQSEADAAAGSGGVNGTGWDLLFGDTDTVAREANYLILAQTADAPPPPTDTFIPRPNRVGPM